MKIRVVMEFDFQHISGKFVSNQDLESYLFMCLEAGLLDSPCHPYMGEATGLSSQWVTEYGIEETIIEMEQVIDICGDDL